MPSHTPPRSPRRAVRHRLARCRTVRPVTPAPGAHTGTIAWTSREHYLDVVVPTALRLYSAPLGIYGVDADTFARYVRVLADAADHHSGRGIHPSDDQIAYRAAMSPRHVRRCRQVAEALGLYHLTLAGRHMTRAERAATGGRRLANEAALVIPAWLVVPVYLPDHAQAEPSGSNRHTYRDVDHVHPPSGTAVGGTCTVSSAVFAPAGATSSTRTDTYPTQQARTPRRTPPGIRLARALIGRLGWLRGCRPGRIAPTLARYERAGWTAGHIMAAIEAIHARLGWDTPTRERLTAPPWGLLAWYLRHLTPDQRPEHTQPPAPAPVQQQVGPAHRAVAPTVEYRQARAALQR